MVQLIIRKCTAQPIQPMHTEQRVITAQGSFIGIAAQIGDVEIKLLH